MFITLCRSRIFHGADRTPHNHRRGMREELSMQNIGICYRFIGIGFDSYDRRQYSGSLLRNLGLTSLHIPGGPDYRFAEAPRPVI